MDKKELLPRAQRTIDLINEGRFVKSRDDGILVKHIIAGLIHEVEQLRKEVDALQNNDGATSDRA